MPKTFRENMLDEMTRKKEFGKKTQHGQREAIRNAKTPAERAALRAQMAGGNKPEAKTTEKKMVTRAASVAERKPEPVRTSRPKPIDGSPTHDLVHTIDHHEAIADPGVHHYQHHLELGHDAAHKFPDKKKHPEHHATHMKNVFAHLANAHTHASAVFHHQHEIAKSKLETARQEIKHHPDLQRMRKATASKTVKGGMFKSAKTVTIPKHRQAEIQDHERKLLKPHTDAYEARKRELNNDYHRRRGEIGDIHIKLIHDHVHDLASAEHHMTHMVRNRMPVRHGPIEKAFKHKLKKRHADILFGDTKKRTGWAKRFMGEETKKFVQKDPEQKPAEIGTDELRDRYAAATPGQGPLKMLKKVTSEAHLQGKAFMKVRNTLSKKITPDSAIKRGQRKIQKTKEDGIV